MLLTFSVYFALSLGDANRPYVAEALRLVG